MVKKHKTASPPPPPTHPCITVLVRITYISFNFYYLNFQSVLSNLRHLFSNHIITADNCINWLFTFPDFIELINIFKINYF